MTTINDMDMEATERFFRRVARTVEECGDCLLWKGAMTNKSVPVMCVAGVTSPVRRSMWVLLGKKLVKGMAIKASCGDVRCIAQSHLEQTKRGRKIGYKATPAQRANIAKARRSVSVLTWDDVREIRASDRPAAEIGPEKGIGFSMVEKIRSGRHWKEGLDGPFAGLL